MSPAQDEEVEVSSSGPFFKALLEKQIDMCCANPGMQQKHFVGSLDRNPPRL